MTNQKEKMKWVLFWTFLILFILMVLGTLGMVFFSFGSPTENERELMVKGLIGEVAACIIALFYSIFGLKGEPQEQAKIERIENEVSKLSSIIESLEIENKKIINNYPNIVGQNLDKEIDCSTEYISNESRALNDFNIEPPYSLEQYAVSPHPDEIKNDLRETRPFDYAHRAESYIGLKVQWKVLFYSVSENRDGSFAITSDYSDSIFTVNFEIDSILIHKFKHIDKMTPFWLAGEISETSSLGIELEDVDVKFE